MRTEELLLQIRRVAQGEESPETAIGSVDTVLEATREVLTRFRAEAQDNPEVTESARQAIDLSLESYCQTLAELRAGLQAENLEQVATLLAQAEEKVQAVRQAQADQRAQLAHGMTLFPFLNRMLLHEAGPRLQALQAEAPTFLLFLRQRLASSPAHGQLVFQLQELLPGLPQTRDQVAEVAQRIAGALAAGADEEPGQTPIPAVNQVLTALGACTGPDEIEFVLALITQCHNYLRQVAPPQAAAALNDCLACLERMEHALRQTRDFDELLAAASELETAAVELAGSLERSGTSSSLDGQAARDFEEKTRDLAPLFRSVLEPAYAYVAGLLGPDPMLAASDHLDSVATQIYRDATRQVVKDQRVDLLREALESMQDAAESLRALEASPDAQLLEAAIGLCRQASQRLAEAGVR